MTDFNKHRIPSIGSSSSQSPLLKPVDRPAGEIPPQRLSSARSYADLKYLFGVQDPTMIPAGKPKGNRRKSTQGSEHVKHRRTRSGCYTCRSRRVKCDETRPICDRCKKGNRECVYPESVPTSAKSTGSASSKSGLTASHESPDSSDDEDEDERDERLESIPDEDKNSQAPDQRKDQTRNDTRPTLHSPSDLRNDQRTFTRYSSETPSLIQDKGSSPTPSTEGSIGYPAQSIGNFRFNDRASFQPSGTDKLQSDLSHLPQDLQFYLTFFYENLTHCHYNLKSDLHDFLRTHFLDAALQNEALLYAVVGFSSFQYTVHKGKGRIQDFLQYYNKAVSLLLGSLRKGDKHNIGTLLAILQLATIEEYLGDWINLFGHQKAAYEILTELYTPQTVMQSEVTRVILGWYVRFDVFASLMGGSEVVLSRGWLSYMQEYYELQISREPWNLTWKIEHAVAQLRLIGMDMSKVFARRAKGELSHEQFIVENQFVSKKIEEWKTLMHPDLQDKRYLVTNFSDTRARDPQDIVDPYMAGKIYRGPLWVMNICLNDWYSIDLMQRLQTAVTIQAPPDGEQLCRIAYAICQLYEAIEYWPESPNGTVIALQASLGLACLFLPRDEAHAMWARRKLATIESKGYIYPHAFRTKMADLFRDRSCMQWWLPNDESYPPAIRSIRKFVEERTSAATSAPTEDLRDMKAVFSSLNLDDEKDEMTSTARGKKLAMDVAIAPADMTQGNIGLQQNETYGIGFSEGQDFWDAGKGR